MITYYHRYVTHAERRKDGTYEAWDIEQLVATDDIAPHNRGKKIRFCALEKLPRELRYAELDEVVTVHLGRHKKGSNLNKQEVT